jgi:hypothetical protein
VEAEFPPAEWRGGQSLRGAIRPPLRDRKFADSLLEGDGFELSVPRERGDRFELFAVGTAIAGRPPPRSGLAQLRHPAPTLGV